MAAASSSDPEPNPYEAPREPVRRDGSYAPLGWLTPAASGAIVLSVVLSLVLGVGLVALPDLKEGVSAQRPDAVILMLAVGFMGLVSMATSLFAMISFLVWQYRAANNLHAFRRYGVTISAGMAVAYWFIPFVSLFMPYQSLAEIWRGSDPEALEDDDKTSWSSGRVPSLLALWWGAYLLSSFVSLAGFFIDRMAKQPGLAAAAASAEPSSTGMASLIATFFSAISAVAIMSIMKQIARRQERCAEKLAL